METGKNFGFYSRSLYWPYRCGLFTIRSTVGDIGRFRVTVRQAGMATTQDKAECSSGHMGVSKSLKEVGEAGRDSTVW